MYYFTDRALGAGGYVVSGSLQTDSSNVFWRHGSPVLPEIYIDFKGAGRFSRTALNSVSGSCLKLYDFDNLQFCLAIVTL